jgi:hypothetical protein
VFREEFFFLISMFCERGRRPGRTTDTLRVAEVLHQCVLLRKVIIPPSGIGKAEKFCPFSVCPASKTARISSSLDIASVLCVNERLKCTVCLYSVVTSCLNNVIFKKKSKPEYIN